MEDAPAASPLSILNSPLSILKFKTLHSSKIMHKRIYIKNAILVNEGRIFTGGVLIDNDRIEEIVEGRDGQPSIPADTETDAEGCYLLPGIIDTHVHFREPGLTHKADFESESRAAAAGGVTTVLDMPNTLPQTTTPEAFEEKLQTAARKCCVNYGLFFGATCDNATALAKLNVRKAAGIKLFMGSSTGNMLIDQPEALAQVFQNTRIPVVAHCEDTGTIRANMERHQRIYGDDPDVSYHSAIRSAEACLKSTKAAIALASEYGTRLHVAHVSTRAELKLIAQAGPNVTAEACLPHLLFTDTDYARLGSRIKCNPAVKTADDRTALRKALLSGEISTVATDHAPHLLREKAGGAVRAASGMPMVQFSLPAMLDLVEEGVLALTDVVRLMCHEPARIFQIENRGYLREGCKADLVLLRRTPWTLTPNRIESKCNWSPLEGHTFRWQVEKTCCNGFLLYSGGQITDTSFRGQPVTFNR